MNNKTTISPSDSKSHGHFSLEQCYKIKAVAEMLCCSSKTIRKKIRNQELKSVRIGKMIRIPESSLQELIEVKPALSREMVRELKKQGQRYKYI